MAQNMLGAFPNMVDGYDIYQKGQQGRANGLAALAMNSQGEQRQGALANLAGIDANQAYKVKKDLDEQDYDGIVKASQMLVSLKGNPELANQWFQRVKPQFTAMGMNLPEQLDDTVWQSAEKIAQAAGGATSNNVQSTFIDPNGELGYLSRNGRVTNTGQKVSDKYSPIVDPVTGQVSGYSSRGNNLAPTAAGNQASGMSEGDLTTYLNALNAKGQELVAAGNDKAQVNAWMDEQIANLPKVFSASPTQARVNVKPDAPKEPKTAVVYDADGNASVVDVSKPGAIPGAVRPGSQPSAKDRQKMETMKRKEFNLVNSNAAKINETVRIIDELLGSGALSGVTGIGALGSKIPGTKWADAAAKLETLRAKSAFGALSEMRANSPTGGALGSVTERELSLLQNAETQLSQAQSPEAFAKALTEYKRILLESQKRMVEGVQGFYADDAQAPSAPASNRDALLDKY